MIITGFANNGFEAPHYIIQHDGVDLSFQGDAGSVVYDLTGIYAGRSPNDVTIRIKAINGLNLLANNHPFIINDSNFSSTNFTIEGNVNRIDNEEVIGFKRLNGGNTIKELTWQCAFHGSLMAGKFILEA